MKTVSLIGQRLLLAAIVLAIWELSSRQLQAFVLPGPLAVFDAFVSLVKTDTFWTDVAVTVRRVLLGFVLSAIVGTVIGVVFGGEPETGRFFRTGHFGIEYGVIGNLGRVRDYLVRHFGRQYGDRRFHDGDAPDPDEYLGRDQDGRPPVR